ncbi:MAG: hypothetical protein EOP51_27880 [Sphingobacteriales bacterium]|nr:MAG: hypothetical protein EOP51_27880 [Sphingobacteriales bacterium]
MLGSAAAPVKTYTLIEVPVKEPKKFTYKTYTAGTNELMELNTLPDSVAGFNGTVFKERARTGN